MLRRIARTASSPTPLARGGCGAASSSLDQAGGEHPINHVVSDLFIESTIGTVLLWQCVLMNKKCVGTHPGSPLYWVYFEALG